MKHPIQSLLIILLLFSGSGSFLSAQERMPDPGIDVLRYTFSLHLEETTDRIMGWTELQIRFPERDRNSLTLELDEGGMTVEEVKMGEKTCEFIHKNQQLKILLPTSPKAQDTLSFLIRYAGVPQDGLIISRNKYGDRTFFGDNWPNRAHFWLPVVDHPADKAYCEFIITAPDEFQVVANGELVEESDIKEGYRLSHWRSTVPLPTKVMVFGAARFAVQYVGEHKGIPVSSWVYPQDREKGFYDYEMALQVLAFMEEYIGPYPYAKLANVQSNTRYGGMENASNIFYAESSVIGDRTSETLIAHEITHQWFGNSASEASWYHLWLSEGFATYFTALYLEDTYGRESSLVLLEANRNLVLASPDSRRPIVDPSITDLNELLNTNAYQKGGWVLHMLRKHIGEEAFRQGVRTYYDRYQFSNAYSKDLQAVMEEVSGQNLEQFFQQWLYQPGFPVIEFSWTYDSKRKKVMVELAQIQKGKPFQIPIELGIRIGEDIRLEQIQLSGKEGRAAFKAEIKPDEVILDPNMWLLFQQK